MNAISLFTTTYLLIGITFVAGVLAYYKEQLDLAVDSTVNKPEERKAVLIVLVLLIVFGWPIIINEFKDR